MTGDDLQDLLVYRPDRQAVKQRMIQEAKKLYEMGQTQKRHQPVFENYEGLLQKFYLYPTFNCPLRCPYCYAEGGERQCRELGAEDLLRMTKQAVDAGYETIVLVGGEQLVYHDWNAYLKGLQEMDQKTSRYVLRTSLAFPVSEAELKELCTVFDEIVVSLDGDAKTNDAMRGKGTWKIITDNIRTAVSLGGSISIAAVLNREQGEGKEGDALRVFCAELGIHKLVINSPVPMGRAKNTHVPYYEWRSDIKKGDQVKMKYSCGLGSSLYVQPDGKVYPCYAWCEKEHLLGDLSRESLQDIPDRGEIFHIINSGVDTNQKCRTCEVRYFCGGMCKIRVNDHHDINSPDFDCTAAKESILEMLKKYGIIETVEGKDHVLADQ